MVAGFMFFWIAILSSTFRLHSRVSPTRPLTLSSIVIRAATIEEFTFADGERDCWLVSTSTVAVWTGSGQERTSRNPGCPTDEETAGLPGGTAFPTSQGLRTSGPVFLSGVMSGVTVLVISGDLEHQDLSCV